VGCPGASPPHHMAILFKGKEINEALTSHEESLKRDRSEIASIQDTLLEKVDRSVFESQLEQASTTAAQRLDAAVREWEAQVSALRERTAALEERQKVILSELATKAEASQLQNSENHLASCIRKLEQRHKDLCTVVDRKAEDVRVDGHQCQLDAVEERLRSLHHTGEQLEAELATRAATVDLERHVQRLTEVTDELRQQSATLDSALSTKACAQSQASLGLSHSGLQKSLGDLAQDLTAKLSDIEATLAKKVDVVLFDQEAERLKATREQLDALEDKQDLQHRQVRKVLATKADQDQAENLQQRHEGLSDIVAHRQDVTRSFAQIQEQLDECRSQTVRYHEQVISDLATKVEKDVFEKQWEQVIVRELRPNIRLQREQLNAALEKKDQLISLAERMQADLGCALALRGRGPPRLGPLVAPPMPSPRKNRLVRTPTPQEA